MDCKNNCGFFASENGYCSKCNKLFSNVCKTEVKDLQINSCDKHYQDVNKIEDRCFKCNKKLKTNILFCKCQKKFCTQHIFYKEHDCDFDFKKHGKEIIKNQNPKIEAYQL